MSEPKSAFELAMERLRQKDREAGAAGERPLTEAQKAAIAEARSRYEGRVAERTILHRAAEAGARSHEELDHLNDTFRRDCERFAADRDRAIAEIKTGQA